MGRRSSTQTTRGDATLRDALVISHSSVNRQTTGGHAKTGSRRTWLRAGYVPKNQSRRTPPAALRGGMPRLQATPWAPWLSQADTSQPSSPAPADAALATRASSRAPARSSLDDVDQLLDGRWRPGDDEAIGGVAGDDPNLGRRDPPEGIRHFAPANAYSRGTSLTVTSSGASRSAGPIHMPPAVLTRRYPCTARAAFRSSSASAGETSSEYHPPFDLSGVEEKRESCEPAA